MKNKRREESDYWRKNLSDYFHQFEKTITLPPQLYPPWERLNTIAEKKVIIGEK